MGLVSLYQERWPRDFLAIRQYLVSSLTRYEAIEHIGSTSVPGMVAKPIIDIIIVVPSGEMERVNKELASLQYCHQGELGIPGREAYDYLPAHIDLPKHHLYSCYSGHEQVLGAIAFRDFLKDNPEMRSRLSTLKLELVQRFDGDRRRYMNGKRALVDEIIKTALTNY